MITLLSDFGLAGPYVAAMKGVILSLNPDARIVDISHDIGPQAVDEAAYVLHQAYPFFPRGTIHVCVVDPGVGGHRAVLAVQAAGHVFLAPDNGILKYVYQEDPGFRAYQVVQPEFRRGKVSGTFHGRDIFAPAAGHLSLGVTPESLGPMWKEPVKRPVPELRIESGRAYGEIVFFDRFGNAVTNIPRAVFPARARAVFQVRGISINGIKNTYSAAKPGEFAAVFGSGDTIEIAIHGDNARKQGSLKIGDPVQVQWSLTDTG
jgi:S-adenosylmethionine hydrolase